LSDVYLQTYLYTFQSGAVGTGVGTSANIGGLAIIAIDVSGITSATVTFQVLLSDNTSDWQAINAYNITTGISSTTTTVNGYYQVGVGGFQQFRCNITGYTSGTINITGRGSVLAPGSSTGITNVNFSGGTNLIGGVATGSDVSVIYNTPSVALTPQFAAIAASNNGNNSLVAAVGGKKILVMQMFLVAGAVGNIYFQSGTGGAVIFGGSTNTIQLAANEGFTLPFSPVGWMATGVGALLNLVTSSTGPFSGGLTYVTI
jgi:hypothetical protein